jgi:hypothetical protein
MAAAAALLLGSPAEAHMGTGLAGGFASGFNHPLAGFDHLLAMVSVGLWGAFLGRPLIYALPVIFPVVMVGGAVLGMLDVPLPPVEIGIALSVIVLGCAELLNDRPGGVIATRSAGGVIGVGCWLSVAASAASVHLPGGLGPRWAFAASLNAGLWSGAVIALAGSRLDLLKALPGVLVLFPAASSLGLRATIMAKVVSSWLIAVAMLAAALQFLPVTPGYMPDHLD